MQEWSSDLDIILVGGGLANGLIAYRLKQLRPDIRVLVLEAEERFGGNHTWSSHEGDLSPAQRAWTAPFVGHRWPYYHVAFPALHRRIDLGYCSVTSDRLHAVLTDAGIPARFECRAAVVEPKSVTLEDGTVITARAVIDGRGGMPSEHFRFGWQKFLGREVRLASPHRLTGPILMDATVQQHDGFRFLYVLPLGPDRLLIEDTAYADGSDLDEADLRIRIDAYAVSKGWVVTAVDREETGVLPITLAGDIGGFWAGRGGQPYAGLRAGLFHPTTGYSWSEAVRLADLIAALPSLDAEPLAAAIQAHAEERWRSQRFFRMLNRLLFLAGPADERWSVMRRFYRLPESTIARFYAGTLTPMDEWRLISGKPPVPIAAAIRAIANRRVAG